MFIFHKKRILFILSTIILSISFTTLNLTIETVSIPVNNHTIIKGDVKTTSPFVYLYRLNFLSIDKIILAIYNAFTQSAYQGFYRISLDHI